MLEIPSTCVTRFRNPQSLPDVFILWISARGLGVGGLGAETAKGGGVVLAGCGRVDCEVIVAHLGGGGRWVWVVSIE